MIQFDEKDDLQFASRCSWATSGYPMTTDEPFKTPGQLIQSLLDERGWTKRVLAMVLGVDETGMNKVIAGTRAVDADIALALHDVFPEVPPERFLFLQKQYDLAKARIVARPDPGRAKRAQLFGSLPVTDMLKRGWLGDVDPKDVSGIEQGLLKFFEGRTLNEVQALPHAAKKTNADEPTTGPQLAWLYRVKEIAGDMIVAKYSEQAVKQGIKKLESFRQSTEEIKNVPLVLMECGIRFLIVESLPSAKIDGVCFWINEASPVVAMTTRYDRIDNFWFVLRHELEHVLRRDGLEHAVVDVELEGEKAGSGSNIPEQEKAANLAASAFCVPPDMMQKFYSRKAPFFAERDVLAFAKMIKVHPGLVAGQLRHRTGRHNIFADLLVKVRHIITPTAIVDGWGDIAPVGA